MFASSINTSARSLSSPAWTGVLALALGAFGIASTHGDAPRVRMVYEAGFCGRCIDWYDTIHIAAADPTRRFGVGRPAHRSKRPRGMPRSSATAIACGRMGSATTPVGRSPAIQRN